MACFDYARFLNFTVTVVGGQSVNPPPSQQSFNLSVNPTTFCSNTNPTFTISNATSGLYGKSIYWSSSFNGQGTGENLAYYGQNLDASGNFSAQAANGSYVNYIGPWTKTATIYAGPGLTNPVTETVNFTVNDCSTPPPAQSFQLSVNPTSFCPSTNPTFTITNATSGLTGKSIYWSSTFNGQPTGENLSYYGESVDGSGNFSAQAASGSYTNYIGPWTKTATIYAGPGLTNPVTQTVNFTVTSCGSPTPVIVLFLLLPQIQNTTVTATATGGTKPYIFTMSGAVSTVVGSNTISGLTHLLVCKLFTSVTLPDSAPVVM